MQDKDRCTLMYTGQDMRAWQQNGRHIRYSLQGGALQIDVMFPPVRWPSMRKFEVLNFWFHIKAVLIWKYRVGCFHKNSKENDRDRRFGVYCMKGRHWTEDTRIERGHYAIGF